MLFRETTRTPTTPTSFSIVSNSRVTRWLFYMQNKLFRDAIQYGLLTFESRMSSGDNEWVVYFPAIIKEAVMISSPGDFYYSRNNPDTIRRRISGVHIFLFLTYSLQTEGNCRYFFCPSFLTKTSLE